MDIRRRAILKRKASSSEGSINVDNYLTIEALEDGLTASLSTNACEYCVDFDGDWKSLAAGTATESINSGHTLSFRGNLTPASNKGIGTFTINKKCDLKGNCMSMLFGDNVVNNYSLSGKNYAFYNLFNSCKNIVNVSSNFLPATTLASYCYQGMFKACSSLTTAPSLHATTLTDYCYQGMFKDCSSLTTAPELPATTLKIACYQYMFQNCTRLTTAPELPATTIAAYCYQYTFQNCTSLTTAPSRLPATTLAANCYDSMFYGCTRLTTAPELPATTLASYCYYFMFNKCSSLTTAPSILPATTLADRCYQTMFSGCTSLTTAPSLPATTLAINCYCYMFSGCTSLTTAPSILPAATLAHSCYSYMFNNCTSLTVAPALPATTLATYCYSDMFFGCTSLATVPTVLPATTLADYCYYYMFQNCTSLTTAPELPATTLYKECYKYMFMGCKKLNYIKMMATDISASNCLNNWVGNVSSTGTFVKNPNMTTLSTGAHGIPSGWTVVNDGEESGGNLITFTINGTEYQAEEGMTWSEWIDSEYNVINASIYSVSSSVDYICLNGQGGTPTVLYTRYGNYVIATQEIITNHKYTASAVGGGA